MKILVLGNVFFSTSVNVSDFCSTDSEVYADTIQNKISGGGIIISAVSSFLNMDVTFCTKTFSNQQLECLLRKLNRLGVKVEKLSGTSINDMNCMISIYNQDLERQCYTFLPNEIKGEDLLEIQYSEYDVIFFCCIPYEHIKFLMAQGAYPISQKTIIIASGLTHQYIYNNSLRMSTDYIFMNGGELRDSLGLKNDIKFLLASLETGYSKAVVTMGKKGVFIKKNNSILHCDVSDETEQIIHPGGAGDAFATGYIVGQLRGLSEQESVQLGHECAKSLLKVRSIEEYIDNIL